MKRKERQVICCTEQCHGSIVLVEGFEDYLLGGMCRHSGKLQINKLWTCLRTLT